MNIMTLITISCMLSVCSTVAPLKKNNNLYQTVSAPEQKPVVTSSNQDQDQNSKHQNVYAGAYLAGRFAQQQHDWKSAEKYMFTLQQNGVDQPDILRRAMVLAIGSGDYEKAMAIARNIAPQENATGVSIAQLLLAVEALKDGQYERVITFLNTIPKDNTAVYVKPFMMAWAQAGLGKLDTKALRGSALQIYHAILISTYLNNNQDVSKILELALQVEELSAAERERIADIYTHIGMTKQALEQYHTVLKDWPDDAGILQKIAKIEDGEKQLLFKGVKNVQEGMAWAFFDIANALYQDYNDESARIFTNLSLYLNPGDTDSTLIMANIAGRHHQYEEAIFYYQSIPKADANYLSARYKIADIYEENNQPEKAKSILEQLVHEKKDVESQIRIGDIYRRDGSFETALEAYNKAVDMIGGKITEDFWYLHYVRGMSYEQIDDWENAEKDLQAALDFKPDNPLVLNYLGYAWADRGMNLDQAMQMISRAVELRPNDGYIVDSLGWVKYRIKDYEGATPILEQAVALMPHDPTINDHLGDAYWRVGRTMEAIFQWKRAINYSKNEAEITKIKQKIKSGLPDAEHLKEARYQD